MGTAWGIVNANGTPFNKGSNNWTVSHEKGTGVYLFALKDKELAVVANLAVVASGYRLTANEDEAAQDNTFSTRVNKPELFEVYSYDTGNTERGTRQDAAFSFIAMWGR